MNRVNPPNTTRDLFVGDSEMARRMRALDWSTTSLGDVSRWPQSLRSALGICIESRFPIAIYWGADLSLLYNDAWSPIPGAKHPWALGRPAIDVWPEIWGDIGPLFEQVVSTGDATYLEDALLLMRRHGYTEECYFNYTFTPIRGAHGTVEGVFNAVIETTFRVIAERRTALLRELGERLAGLTTIGDVCTTAAGLLARDGLDATFCLIYLFDENDQGARRAAVAGIPETSPAAPAVVRLADEPTSVWPLLQPFHATQTVVIDDLQARIGPLPGGSWPDPTTAAIMAPVATGASERRAGVLLMGASPRRAIDDEYRQFVVRAASQVSAALTTVTAYELERTRAEALAQLDRAKTVFFSNVSHEFRTPLTLMLGPIEEAIASPAKALTGVDLDATHRNAVRLLKLVNTLLDFARIESGRSQVAFQPVDLAALTRDCVSAFRAAVERAGLRLTVDCPTLDSVVYVDATMWEKVVLNLLSNALKFTFEGEIRVALHESAGVVELTVADTGVGIPEHELPRLFERFHRVEGTRARTHEGSGIGLALVHDLVQLHGGSVRVDSRLGEGTRFTVTLQTGSEHLPADKVVHPTADTPTAAGAEAFVAEAMSWVSKDVRLALTAPTAASASIGSPRQVLVADDNADLRDYITRLLHGMCEVTAVTNGDEALAALRAKPFDLIVTDVMMPGLDGFGLLRQIRSDPSLQNTQVIMLSARAGEEARIDGLEHGADDYLVKPFAARELVAKVASRLGLADARRHTLAERDRLRELLSQIPAIVNFLSGPDLVIEFAHPLAVKAAGGRELEGKTLLEAFPEFRGQPFADTLQQVFRTGEAVSLHESLVHLDKTNSGAIVDTYWNSMYLPVRTDSGAIEGVMTFDIDVTEQVLARQRAEEQTAALTRAHEAAKSANRAKDEFLAMLGHELRNPLSPITTAVQLMRLRGAEFRELAVIERQVGHLTRLVDDLLDVSRITRGKISLHRQPIEVCEVVGRAVEIASPLLEQRRHVLNIDVPTEGLMVDGDRERLAQVVSNLLTNAARYSNPESPIFVTARSIEGRVQLRVRDVGIGIQPEMLTLVFDAFVQERQAIDRARGGLGLGLTIAKTLIAMHEGSIRAESQGPGHGSEFIVDMPMSTLLERTAESKAPPETAAMPSRGLRILVVDDNTDAADLLTQALQHLGYELATAHDGPSALERTRQFHPDVALLDIGLPVMDGYELAEHLKNSGNGSAPPILIAVTGYGQETDRERTAAAGFRHHLVKPIDIQELTSLLDRLSADR